MNSFTVGLLKQEKNKTEKGHKVYEKGSSRQGRPSIRRSKKKKRQGKSFENKTKKASKARLDLNNTKNLFYNIGTTKYKDWHGK